ncbi:hypothetical protein O7632_02480 [Solwaraspora sp. WMMD406]|uniref:hypothetical protein n=1 Tax=Solwaraspora sp. WMMD406 TaxID=3016095 RepID=UPI002418073E|nr:hypothetical protein [Solwaraspora sp. WMMD406]MDG4762983.1 hypothetical protein [Solwaraspora sp. WMMD406]
MDEYLLAWLALAAIWLAAGVVADGLPTAGTPAVLRRRATGLLASTTIGLAGFVALTASGVTTSEMTVSAGPVGVLGDTSPEVALRALTLATVPAVAVCALTVPRLYRLRRGSAAFATAPATPSPPGLLADAAHPLLALPVQVTALALLPAAAQAAGGVPMLGTSTDGLVTTGVIVLLAAAGVRHSLRHHGLAERAVTGRMPSPAASARMGRSLH